MKTLSIQTVTPLQAACLAMGAVRMEAPKYEEEIWNYASAAESGLAGQMTDAEHAELLVIRELLWSIRWICKRSVG